MDTLNYIILGLYTLIYVVVFIIQQRQIKSQKETSSKMAELLNLFDMEKIKSYVRLSEDEAQMAAKKIIRDDTKRLEEKIEVLEKENAKLKDASADQSLENESSNSLSGFEQYKRSEAYNHLFSTLQNKERDIWDLMIQLADIKSPEFSMGVKKKSYREFENSISVLQKIGEFSTKFHSEPASKNMILSFTDVSEGFYTAFANYVLFLDIPDSRGKSDD